MRFAENSVPLSLPNGPATGRRRRRRRQDHITTVVRGVERAYAWDVANEAVAWVNGAWSQRRDGAFQQTRGDDGDEFGCARARVTSLHACPFMPGRGHALTPRPSRATPFLRAAAAPFPALRPPPSPRRGRALPRATAARAATSTSHSPRRARPTLARCCSTTTTTRCGGGDRSSGGLHRTEIPPDNATARDANAATRAPTSNRRYDNTTKERYDGKAAAIEAMVRGLLARGVPIDGVGFQVGANDASFEPSRACLITSPSQQNIHLTSKALI